MINDPFLRVLIALMKNQISCRLGWNNLLVLHILTHELMLHLRFWIMRHLSLPKAYRLSDSLFEQLSMRRRHW